MLLDISSCGKLVFCGEISVLFGFTAISIGIPDRLNFKIKASASKSFNFSTISISSDLFNFALTKENFQEFYTHNESNKDYHLCLKCIEILDLFSFNLNLQIKIISKIPNGLGSSGAIIANFSALYFYLKSGFFCKKNKKFILTKKNLNEIFTIGCNISETIFKENSSHIDIATSIYGKIILYKKKKIIKILKTTDIKDIFLFKLQSEKKDVGFTLNVIKNNNNHDYIIKCFNEIDKISKKSFLYLKNNDYLNLIKNINLNQNLLENLSIIDNETRKIKEIIAKYNIDNFKISGSGFGDFGFSIDKKINKLIDKIEKDNNLIIKKISIPNQGLTIKIN